MGKIGSWLCHIFLLKIIFRVWDISEAPEYINCDNEPGCYGPFNITIPVASILNEGPSGFCSICGCYSKACWIWSKNYSSFYVTQWLTLHPQQVFGNLSIICSNYCSSNGALDDLWHELKWTSPCPMQVCFACGPQ